MFLVPNKGLLRDYKASCGPSFRGLVFPQLRPDLDIMSRKLPRIHTRCSYTYCISERLNCVILEKLLSNIDFTSSDINKAIGMAENIIDIGLQV